MYGRSFVKYLGRKTQEFSAAQGTGIYITQWRNFGSGRPLAKNASHDGAPLKIFTDLPLFEFWSKTA